MLMHVSTKAGMMAMDAVHEGGVEAHLPRSTRPDAGAVRKLNEKLNFPYCAAPLFPV